MNFFNKLQAFSEKFIGPIATKLNDSELIKGLSTGMMRTMPITLGVAAFAILVNLPITAWQNFLANSGLYTVTNEIISVTMSMLAIYVVISVSSCYAKVKGESGLTAALISTGAFLCLMPQTVEGKDGVISALQTSYLGSNGIFVAMITGLAITGLYCWLCKKNITLKLPDTVPPMVSQSMSPTFISMIIFVVVLVVKYLVFLTPYGNVFDLLSQTITQPILNVGGSPWALIGLYTFTNILWFFGIHPSPIVSAYTPVLITCMTANVEAFMAGTPSASLPHLVFMVVFITMNMGGNGNTLGLAISMAKAKSEHFKAMFKLSFVPCLFNINEPMVFGVPIMLNPIFFIPMVLTTPITGGIAYLLANLGFGNGFNPTISAPWIMPAPITGFLEGGIMLAIVPLVCILANVILYYPFFKIADNQALAEEQGSEAQ